MRKQEPDLFSIRVCLCRLVVLHELVVHELEGEGRLADATGTDHDHLVKRAETKIETSLGAVLKR